MILYKYVATYLWKKILENKLIRFTQPLYLNDPFEMQPSYASLVETPEFEEQFSEAAVKDMFENELQKVYENLPTDTQKLLPIDFLKDFFQPTLPKTVEDVKPIGNFVMDIVSKGLNKGFAEHIGVLSLTEKRDNRLMWAHYAQNHKGFVIGFDSEDDYFHQQRSEFDEFYHLRKVQYSENRPEIQLMSAEDGTEIFLTKSKEWEYEQEWRMLKPVSNATETITTEDEIISLFSFPAKCVAEIIIGCRMLASDRKELLEYLASNKEFSHVKKYNAVMGEKKFVLDIVPDATQTQ
jgi:hypothetical protein